MSMPHLFKRSLLVGAVAVAIAAAPQIVGTFGITLMNYIGIYTLVALGLVLLTGAGGLTSFGQAAFVGIGAYATGYITTALDWSPWLGLCCAMVLIVLIALLIGYATLHLGGHYLPITTMAWGVSIYLLFGNFEALGRYGGLTHIPPISVFGWPLERTDQVYYLIWIIVALSMLAAVNILGSRQGRAIRALRGSLVLVESLGIDSFRVKLALFLISAVLAALAGWLYAHTQHFISPATFDLRAGIEFLLMAVLGGSGHVSGALIGAIAITLAKDWLQDLLPLVTKESGNLEIVAFGILFILLLQYAPRGLAPLATQLLRDTHPAGSKPNVDGASPLSKRRMPAVGEPLLVLDAVSKRYGGLVAADAVSFTVPAGTIFALIGPNGAGKSTIFNVVTGVVASSGGRVTFQGRNLTGASQRDVVASGISRTFQHVKLRPFMSVLENVMLGAYGRTTTGFVRSALKFDGGAEKSVRAEAYALLEQVGLAEKWQQAAGTLPLGHQRVLEIARALAADPVLIMLDEPAAGLRSFEKEVLAELLNKLRARGVTILLVEHDMEFLMGLADRIVVVDFGHKIADGTAAEVRVNPRVQEAYLGAAA